jgi:hypothetical protein
LDLDLLSNFTAAWRPLHVKTDVFCSAGLTLPDKVGRQINIGGWANDATFGIRLYWPDGSPGVWGVNDWQENVDEVRTVRFLRSFIFSLYETLPTNSCNPNMSQIGVFSLFPRNSEQENADSQPSRSTLKQDDGIHRQ